MSWICQRFDICLPPPTLTIPELWPVRLFLHFLSLGCTNLSSGLETPGCHLCRRLSWEGCCTSHQCRFDTIPHSPLRSSQLPLWELVHFCFCTPSNNCRRFRHRGVQIWIQRKREIRQNFLSSAFKFVGRRSIRSLKCDNVITIIIFALYLCIY